jgi:hypothetical protein
MDDTVWWCDGKNAVEAVFGEALEFARRDLLLEVKLPAFFGRSRHGLSFCGFRILPGALLLSRRRKQRYAFRRQHEDAYRDGRASALQLQAGYASALALAVQADAVSWRREQLRRQPLASELHDV